MKSSFLIILILVTFNIKTFARETVSSKPWMRYTALSPDGSQIAFTYKGDIYIVSSSGGKAIRLTSHTAYDVKPVWSHDGNTIAFASNRYGNFDLFIIPSQGGKTKRLTFYSADDWPTDFSISDDAVIFNSIRIDSQKSLLFHRLGELYRVKLDGSRPEQIMTIPAWEAKYNKTGDLIFEEIKGYEDEFRKHHTSSVTRDIWIKKTSGECQKLTDFEGEDRNGVFSSDSSFFYLSEQSGTFNVHKAYLSDPKNSEQISTFDTHPVRYLSVSNKGILCYSYNGEIFTQKSGEDAVKIEIEIEGDESILPEKLLFVNGNVAEMVPSPNGKEIIFIFRGEVFVTTVEGSLTRRLTFTPEEEKDIDISKDGKSIVYASERNNSWNLYIQKIPDEDDKYFSTTLESKEEVLLANNFETFQPKFSPNSKEVAFIEERVKLKKINIKTKEITSIHDGQHNFSYADGDQFYEWSPDGKWFAIEFYPDLYWFSEVGLISSDGKGEIINLTQSGFSDYVPQWSKDGSVLYWLSDRDGMHSVAKTGSSEADVYGVFLTQQAYDKYKLKKNEYELLYGEEKEKKEDEKDSKKNKKSDADDEKEIKPIEIDFDQIKKRKEKFTLFSSRMSDALITKDIKHLIYLARVEKEYQLWKTDLRTKETKSLGKFGKKGGNIGMDKDGKNIFVLSSGKIFKIDLKDSKKKPVKISGEMSFNLTAERLYLMDHVTRQVEKKFLDTDLHGVAWDKLSENYKQFVADINNDHDFEDILSELLGELNASHTGARYRSGNKEGDKTASLGAFYDNSYQGAGLKILEVMEGSPLIQGEKKIKPGIIIEAIDGTSITSKMNYYPLLNRKTGKITILSLYNPATKEKWKEAVKPISISSENELRYQRWIKRNREKTHQLSGDKIGYMHIRNMSDYSFREFLEDVMGEEVNKQALIVDTRFNGGGDLVDDICSFLSGEKYMEFKGHDRIIGFESQRRWTKPSVMLISESNYSDAHCTPVAYKDLQIGKLIGMPVPGTCSFVWWERMQNGVVFGIPNMAVTDISGDVLENKQLEPDIKIKNEFDKISTGQDQQIKEAVKELLKQIE